MWVISKALSHIVLSLFVREMHHYSRPYMQYSSVRTITGAFSKQDSEVAIYTKKVLSVRFFA